MISISNLRKCLNSTMGSDFLLSSINMAIKPSTMTAILGTNGSGKSTLLKLIAGDFLPDAGSISLQSNSDLRSSKFVALYLDQDSWKDIVPSMTVEENLYLAQIKGHIGSLRFPSTRYRRDAARTALSKVPVGLERRMNEQSRFLSGGERQALVLSRALLCDFDVLLLDEFSSSLSLDLAVKTMSILKQLVQKNSKYCLFVTHQFDLAFRYADDIVFMHNGHLLMNVSLNSAETRDQVLQLYSRCLKESMSDV